MPTSDAAAPVFHPRVELPTGPGGGVRTTLEPVSTDVPAVLAFPVQMSGIVGDDLNPVRRRAHRWSADEMRANEAYAKVIGVTLDLAVPMRG